MPSDDHTHCGPQGCTSHGQVPAPAYYRVLHKLIGPLLHASGLSCRRFNELAALRMDIPLTAKESVSFTIHRIVCTLCRPMPKQLARLRKWIISADRDDGGNPPPLPEDVSSRLRDALDEATRDGKEN